jgi:hypothetical protein
MKKAIIEIEYDENFLIDNDTTLENELQWLNDSEITVIKIIEKD